MSFFMVVIMMFIFNYILFKNSMSGMYDQVKKNNRLVVQNMIQSFDNIFQSVDRILYTVDMVKNNNNKLYDSSGHKNLNMLEVHQISKNLVELSSTQEYIDEIVVFFANSDLVITTQGTMGFKEFFEQKYSNGKYTSAFWNNFNYIRHPTTIIPPTTYLDQFSTNRDRTKELLAIVDSNILRYYRPSTLVFVDKKKLFEMVNDKNIFEGTSLTILDQNQNLVLNIGESIALEEIQNYEFTGQNTNIIRSKEYEYYIEKSSYNDFVYIHAVPVNYLTVFKTIKTNQKILIINVLCGIFLALLLSLYLYNPIKKIFNVLGIKDNKGGDYWKSIKKNIITMQQEKEVLTEQMQLMKKDVRKSIFLQMIQTGRWDQELKDNIETYFSTFYTNKKYAMILFAFYKKQDIDEPEVLPLGQITEDIRNQMQEKFQNSFVLSVKRNEVISLVGLPFEETQKELKKNLKEIVDRFDFKQYIPLIYLSQFYTEEYEFSKAYHDLQIGKSYRKIHPSKDIITIEQMEYKFDVYFPHDVKDKIYHFILSGNAKECIDFIHHVLDENIKKNIAHIKYINLVTDIFNSIMMTLGLCGYEKNKIFQIEQNFLKMANEDVDDQEIRWLLDTIIQQAVEKVKREKENKLNKSFIMEYINLHYMEGLYLENMAELVDTTPKYFSNFFKREFGVNFVEYLNSVRISHAKDYLKNTDIAINEISQKVGYLSPSTFATTFKKYAGISPSQYRQNIQI